MRSMKSSSADEKKKTHHHHRNDPSVAARAKAKILAKNEAGSDEEEYDEDPIPGVNPISRKVSSSCVYWPCYRLLIMVMFILIHSLIMKKRKMLEKKKIITMLACLFQLLETKSALILPWQ